MAKSHKPKSAPAIDMTPMVDLAFLLVTFFMLSANFRQEEIVPVDIPASIAEHSIPNGMMVRVTVDRAGRIFFGMDGKEEVKKAALLRIASKHNINFTPKQMEEFVKLSDIGVPVNQLQAYLDLDKHNRDEMISKSAGLPTDSTNNQLKDWISAAKGEMLSFGEEQFTDAKAKGKDVQVSDFKPKFVMKVDGDADYIHAKRAIETFRELKENNISFITSLKADPRKSHH